MPHPASGTPDGPSIRCWCRLILRLSLRQFCRDVAPVSAERPMFESGAIVCSPAGTVHVRHSPQRSGSHSRPEAKQGHALVVHWPALHWQPLKKFAHTLWPNRATWVWVVEGNSRRYNVTMCRAAKTTGSDLTKTCKPKLTQRSNTF